MEENFIQVKLPSSCKVYTDVNPANISIRTFKGKDEKLIAEIISDNLEQKFLAVFRQVLKGIDPVKLTNGDRLYLLVWEVINSYSPEYPIQYTCSSCLQQANATVRLDELNNVELPEDFVEPYEIKLDNGDIVKLRLFRVEDEIKIAEYERTGKGSWLYRYALSLVSDKGIWDKIDYLENLSTRDIAKIRAFHDKFVHGPQMEQECKCNKCGALEVVACPFRLDMLLPFGKALERYFGNAVQSDVLPKDVKK